MAIKPLEATDTKNSNTEEADEINSTVRTVINRPPFPNTKITTYKTSMANETVKMHCGLLGYDAVC
jgi:hypothetical protein